MSPKVSCGVVALVAAVVVGYTSIAAMLLGNADVQALLGELFHRQIDLSLTVLGLNFLAAFGLVVALSLLAVAQLIPEEMTPPSPPARQNNRLDRVREVAT